MEASRKVDAASPRRMLRINIDTDQIIPALFLGGTDAKGYGATCSTSQRYLARRHAPNPDFILNRAP